MRRSVRIQVTERILRSYCVDKRDAGVGATRQDEAKVIIHSHSNPRIRGQIGSEYPSADTRCHCLSTETASDRTGSNTSSEKPDNDKRICNPSNLNMVIPSDSELLKNGTDACFQRSDRIDSDKVIRRIRTMPCLNNEVSHLFSALDNRDDRPN